jgi:DNA-binding NarL/FixJ family response regulator
MNKLPFFNIHTCDDHQIVTKGIITLLSEIEGVEYSFSNSKEELLKYLSNHKVDILILDINIKSQNMLYLIPEIKTLHPFLKIILFTNYNSGDVIKEVIKYEIHGFLDKTVTSEEFKKCIIHVQNDKKYLSYESKHDNFIKDKYEMFKDLTERELDVLKLLVKGMTNKQISDNLCISILTVQTHRKNMYQKLQLKGVNELVAFAYENNLY